MSFPVSFASTSGRTHSLSSGDCSLSARGRRACLPAKAALVGRLSSLASLAAATTTPPLPSSSSSPQSSLSSPSSRKKALVVPRSSSSTSSAAVSAEPLTKQDLVAYLASGCKPKEKWRFGTEHEKLAYYSNGGTSANRRLEYKTIAALLSQLCARFGWDPIVESGEIIGAAFEGQSVTLEPGGQLELSGAPVDTLHKTCAEVNSHLYQVKTIASELGVKFLGLGFDPKWAVDDVPRMPKSRYKIMREYMPRVGSLGLDMMFRSCTIQVNVDFCSEKDMAEKMKIGMALQPVATALFANSPFRDGRKTGFKSWRSHVWTDVDGDRCGVLPFVFDDGFGFESYVDYALDVPMYFVYEEGNYVDCTQRRFTFRDFMEGGGSGNSGSETFPSGLPKDRKASLKDWENHLTTLFPEVRLKKFIEMRGADGGPWEEICALPALWVGLLYDDRAQADALRLVSDWSLDEHRYLRDSVPKGALATPFREGTLADVAREVVAISERGLAARGKDEQGFVAPLRAFAESGRCRSDELLDLFDGPWNGSVDPVYSPDFTY